jgi:dienelactone hydrolase
MMSTLHAASNRVLRIALMVLAFCASTGTQAAPADVGVVLLHGKWGQPGSMQALARDLESRGYRVSVPEMAWSGRRLYDKDYPSALLEIEEQARQLRGKGAKRIVIAGQSLGANAAVAYAVSGMDADALALLAPGHFPDRGMGGKASQMAYQRARSLVDTGHGADAENFVDFNQGRQRPFRMSASIYVSYFDPAGLGAMTRNLPKLPRPLPVLLAIGTQDPFYPDAKALFDSAPAHPGSRLAVLEGDHFGMPNLVAAELLKWLETIPQ